MKRIAEKEKIKELKYFALDLGSKKPEVLDFSGKDLAKDIKYFKSSDPKDLSDYSRKVFRKEKEAEKYLKKFKKTLKKLPKLRDGGWERGPSLIYKRHYLVQSYLGEKLQTYRDYKKDWKPGQIIKLYDQTYYILVRLKKITKKSNKYNYEFRLV